MESLYETHIVVSVIGFEINPMKKMKKNLEIIAIENSIYELKKSLREKENELRNRIEKIEDYIEDEKRKRLKKEFDKEYGTDIPIFIHSKYMVEDLDDIDKYRGIVCYTAYNSILHIKELTAYSIEKMVELYKVKDDNKDKGNEQ